MYVDGVDSGGATHTLIVCHTHPQSNEACPSWLRERAFPRLMSRDPAHFWTSGQWMTERQGGSDVGTSRPSLSLGHQFPNFILFFAISSPPFHPPRPHSAGGTATSALRQPDGSFHLHGYKWFTSATDADMAFTLARVVGGDGSVGEVNS